MKIEKQANRQRKWFGTRTGAATVEFAVCMPVIVLIVLGSIEGASMLFLRQAMVQSAYEGVKTAIKHDSDNARARAAAEDVARGRGLVNFNVEFSPSDVSTVPSGQFITVTTSAPGDENSLLPFGPFRNRLVSASAVMVKE
jgi:Flp pilus assembly protein TadG